MHSMQGLTPPIGHTCYSVHQKHLLHSGFITWCTHYRLTNLVFTIHSSSGITFSSKNETVSLDNNKVSKGENPPPVEGYEKMEALNPLPLPPKSPPKKPLNKSSTAPQNAGSTRYSKHHAGAKPQPHVVPKWGQKQQQLQRPLSEDGIYECPD